MTVHRIDPLTDSRWAKFLGRHPGSSIFHTPGWLEALRRTYGYDPVVYTTSPPERELTNGIPFCRIHTWLTGRRLVSLPFSDHCAPLVDCSDELIELLAAVRRDSDTARCKYAELRPEHADVRGLADFTENEHFCLHTLSLRPALDELYRRFHKDCVQRKIQRAGKEGLAYSHGASEDLLRHFYGLLLQTRRRHGLPPQPLQWFRNLIACLGDRLKIRVASKDGQPVAAILTLRHQTTLVYKYGCSDERYNNLGGTPFLFWKTITEAKETGCDSFDLGRTDTDNSGLITFKDRWGARRTSVVYLRYSLRRSQNVSRTWQMNLARQFFTRMPNPFLSAAGELIYRHIG